MVQTNIYKSTEKRNDAVVGNVSNKQILSLIADEPDLLSVPLAVDADGMSILRELLGNDSLVYNMSRSNIVHLLSGLDAEMRRSLSEIIGWDPAILKRLSSDHENLRILCRIWDLVPDRTGFVNTYFRMLHEPEALNVNVRDAFSQGQVSSKAWLIDQVAKLDLDLGLTWILCGWIGTLGHLMLNDDRLVIDKIKSFDIDPNCAPLADILNKKYLENQWEFKAVTMDVHDLGYESFSYRVQNSKGRQAPLTETPNTVINTSCDHMLSRSWYDAIPSGMLVILQNNNWADNQQHSDTVDSLDEFISAYPMSEYLFSGELDCKIYTRFMLIGRK